jgi:hypothetical protein
MPRFNVVQVIAIFGIIFSAAAQFALWIFDKKVENIVYLYPTWVAIFLVAMLANPFLPKDDHHH